MKIVLCNQNKISKLILPEKIEGSFWLEDEFTNSNMINIEANNGKWTMYSNEEAKVKLSSSMDKVINDAVATIDLEPAKNYYLEYNNVNMRMFIENSFDHTVKYYKVNDNFSFSIGASGDKNITIPTLENNDFLLNYINNEWILTVNQTSGIYHNGFLVTAQNTKLHFGDTLFVLGIRITVYKNMFSINNIYNNIRINTNQLVSVDLKQSVNQILDVKSSDSIKEEDYYKEEDYFFKKARIRRFIETYDLKVTPPPRKSEREEMPIILVLGPMLTMGLVSVVNLVNIIMKIVDKETTLEKSIPSLVMTGGMLMSSLLWPNLTRRFQKKMEKRKEKTRQKKYREYMEEKKKEILDVTALQRDILQENMVTINECQDIILNKKINIWERRKEHKDFLTVRIGLGDCPIDMKIQFTEEDFTMDEDDLRKEIEKMINEAKMLRDVPISYSFNNKKVTALMGEDNYLLPFVDNILMQLLTFHSYDDLKIIFLVSKRKGNVWDKYKHLFHNFSNNKAVRYFADDLEEAKNISDMLLQELSNRFQNYREEMEENEVKEKSFSPFYLIITDDYPMYRKLGIIEQILKIKESCGFGLVCVENQIRRLPSECVDFIFVNNTESNYYCTDINNSLLQKFKCEEYANVDFEKCYKTLSNIPIEFNEEIHSLPTALGFLEMFRVGKVEQLNTLNRWRLNDPIKSLRAQIGINDQENPIYLDLHEKYHGPHGLIAGTTGSGKSEFIITYILSLSLNYSPNEVAFILIDYKGGGLAGAFENKTKGVRLPHLAGTITNLDKSELNRTLISIDSELKRRQAKFNEVREKLGESTIDIYKYQKFFREKKIDEPMPHLFIISDEFAELKAQQPEFMDDLISAARIGRSLGIHLILATQKPSGVVNDQIWSNTKFRVCLKVQDRSDSNEMLKLPDAATITNAGRFYLQVGNNEIFVLGQSGWAGTQYVASETAKKKYDRSISFIDDVGSTIKNLEETETVVKVAEAGDELSNVLKYICDLAEREKLKASNLWLDKIPGDIYVDSLVKKYNYKKSDGITAILGEYDAPSKQYQNILTLKLNEEGNTLVFGVSGSNKEMFIASIIYSLCIQYTSDEINLYIVDYGSESLRMYNKFPQVGDIVYASENDKLNKLFNIITEEISYRKKLFADYNGEYKTYLKLSGKKLPLKVIIINNYDSFKENHPNVDELLIKFTREGERYGIVFIISAISGGSIYSKLERNFHNKFMLDVTDRTDYIDVLGRIGNIYPAECEGRGLFKREEIYEFQTAQIHPVDGLLEYIKQIIEKVKEVCPTNAPNIPSLPEEVTIEEHLLPTLNNINNLPIGIIRRNLKICGYNFFNNKANIISAKNIKSCINVLNTIIYEVRKLNHMTVLIDTEQELSSIGGTVNTYVDQNFEEFILKFEDFLDKEIDGKPIKVLCIITGLEKFQGSLYEKKAKAFFNGVKTLENINLIFVDSSFKLKKLGYEQWYSSLVDNNNGIWVGPGFMEQTVISSSDYSNKFKEKIDNQFAWVSKNGEAELVKIVGEKGEEDEE